MSQAKKPLLALRNRALVEFMYSSGMRVNEIVSLGVEDIDFWNGTVRVVGKGNKERIVPVGDVALRAIRNYLKAKDGSGFLDRNAGEEARLSSARSSESWSLGGPVHPLFANLKKGRLT